MMGYRSRNRIRTGTYRQLFQQVVAGLKRERVGVVVVVAYQAHLPALMQAAEKGQVESARALLVMWSS